MTRTLAFHALLALMLLGTGCRKEEAPSPAPIPIEAQPSMPRVSDSVAVAGPGEEITFSLPTLDGDTLALASMRGKVVLVNFWATWCVPCREEIPDLNQLATELGPKGLGVLGVSLDLGGAEVVRPFVQEHPFSYPVLLGESGLPDRISGLMVLPTTLVVGKDGRLVRRLPGRLQVGVIRPLLEELLVR